MPDGSTTVIIQGNRRFELEEVVQTEPFFTAKVKMLHDEKDPKDKEFEALISSIRDISKQIIKLSPNIPSEASTILHNINNPTFLIHFVVSNMNVEVAKKQTVLEVDGLKERASKCMELLNEEFQLLELKNQIQSKTKVDLDKQQRDYFLNQQMRIIQEELGGDGVGKEVKRLKEKSQGVKFSTMGKEAFDKELALNEVKVKPFHDKAKAVKSSADSLVQHIELLKDYLIIRTDKRDSVYLLDLRKKCLNANDEPF